MNDEKQMMCRRLNKITLDLDEIKINIDEIYTLIKEDCENEVKK